MPFVFVVALCLAAQPENASARELASSLLRTEFQKKIHSLLLFHGPLNKTVELNNCYFILKGYLKKTGLEFLFLF